MDSKDADSPDLRELFQREVTQLWPVLRGSLCEVRRACLRPGCRACASGRKHRSFLLAYRDGDRQRCLYVPLALVPVVRQAVENGRRIEKLMSGLGPALVQRYRQERSSPGQRS